MTPDDVPSSSPQVTLSCSSSDLILVDLPIDVLFKILSLLSCTDLIRVSATCRKLRALASTDGIWQYHARDVLVTNATNMVGDSGTPKMLSQKERVMISQHWVKGQYERRNLMLQKFKYMPCIVLDGNMLWVSWGSRIFRYHKSLEGDFLGDYSHLPRKHKPRNLRGHHVENSDKNSNGRRMSHHSLFSSNSAIFQNYDFRHRQHSSVTVNGDISKFVIRNNLLITADGDATLRVRDKITGTRLCARELCHRGGIAAIDVENANNHDGPTTTGPMLLMTGSKDKMLKVWRLKESEGVTTETSLHEQEQGQGHGHGHRLRHGHGHGQTGRDGSATKVYGSRDQGGRAGKLSISQVHCFDFGDRIWSLQLRKETKSPSTLLVGTSGYSHIVPIHVYDVERSVVVQELGRELMKGAGTFDLKWQSHETFFSCGYDSHVRMWDLRVPDKWVNCWEEPFDEAIFRMETDHHVSLLCGSGRGLVHLYDSRKSKKHVQMYYTKSKYFGLSSPCYGLACDFQTNLYVGLDQCLNHFSFANGAGHNLSE